MTWIHLKRWREPWANVQTDPGRGQEDYWAINPKPIPQV